MSWTAEQRRNVWYQERHAIFSSKYSWIINKFYKIQNLFGLYKNIDILTLSETHITSHGFNDNVNLYHIPGYTFIKKNRARGGYGGVAMYISDRLKWKRRRDLEREKIEGIFIEIEQKNTKGYLVGSLYRPPESSKHLHKNFNNVLNELLSVIDESMLECIILGDLNADYLKKNVCKALKDIITLHGYEQLIDIPTRVTEETNTCIDVILTNNKTTISDSGAFPLSMSDHDIIGCVRKVHHVKYQYKTITCRNYAKYDPKLMQEDLKSQNLNEIKSIQHVKQAWSILKDKLKTVFDKHAPKITKRVKGRFCPWLTVEVKQQINRKDQLLRKFRKSKDPNDWNLYRIARNHCNWVVKRAKQTYHNNLLNENRHNPRKFWQSIKSVFPSNQSEPPKLTVDDVDINKPNKFCSFFSKIARNLKERSLPLIDFIWRLPTRSHLRCESQFRFTYVSKIYIERELKSLKRHKATGHDDLPSNLIKDILAGP